MATGTAPVRNSTCQLRCSTITPLSTRPTPPPIPNTEDTVPIATPTLCAGNSSRMMPKLSGKIAAPAPCSARKATSDPMFQAAAAPRLASPKIASETTIIRFLPCASPSLPMIGVSTELETRKLVTSQVVHSGVVWNSRWKNGSDGTTSVCISAKAIPATVSRASVTLWDLEVMRPLSRRGRPRTMGAARRTAVRAPPQAPSVGRRLRGRLELAERQLRALRVANHGDPLPRHVERLGDDRPAELAGARGARVGIGDGERDA